MPKRRGTAAALVGGAVAAAGSGAVAADQGWLQTLVDGFIGVLDRHGLAVALATVFMPGTLGLCWYLLRVTLQGKDDEIARLVSDRNKLLTSMLKDRPSSAKSRGGRT